MELMEKAISNFDKKKKKKKKKKRRDLETPSNPMG
jgi:hypothetical protein